MQSLFPVSENVSIIMFICWLYSNCLEISESLCHKLSGTLTTSHPCDVSHIESIHVPGVFFWSLPLFALGRK